MFVSAQVKDTGVIPATVVGTRADLVGIGLTAADPAELMLLVAFEVGMVGAV